jgi:2,5-diamino-6-(ribosylamino)-4(3H)-pyrimidinone 5'-phosphate reductase
MAPPREALTFPPSQATLLDPYLPSREGSLPWSIELQNPPLFQKPHVTLTYATSLDSSLSLSPGVQTILSGPQSKAMTHYLRSRHTAILVGCGTAIADDPSLNCRIQGAGAYGGAGLHGQPVPIVLDPRARWNVSEDSKVVQLAKEGRGYAPWIIVSEDTNKALYLEKDRMLGKLRGNYVVIPSSAQNNGRLDWGTILQELGERNISSVMIEGGGTVIEDLLAPQNLHLVDSVIITIAPTWLGKGGVAVIPDERRDEQQNKIAVGRLEGVRWVPLGEDVVLCGRPART